MNKIRVTKSLVPNLLTLVNLFSGFAAIVYTAEGDIKRAALFIFIAAIFDMLDGLVARLINAASEFGAELDSLCDVVSFGVAPSYMLYKVYFYQFNEFGILLAALPALTGAARLARFNIQLTSLEDKIYFKGLPIPSAALTIISFILFADFYSFGNSSLTSVIFIGLTLVVAYSMVSTVKFDNIPRPSKKSFQQRPIIMVLFIIGLLASIISFGKLVFAFMLFYILASTIRHLYHFIKDTREPDDELDDIEESEPTPF
ncbi:MAG: CDP-diacylglycerol--serine O-phosphatidyltransferase [Candidatus Kapabacteria bacterium]|nr:CDP-diacylglycerol--serine O-phosphatidyltransferase [Ignavibacteriota bacterium]MCW5885682.1 CDP-diacylglycerol--serine O-phosphatidyltransferase [Candidatus Kapabacteria bacterium]